MFVSAMLITLRIRPSFVCSKNGLKYLYSFASMSF